MTARDFRSLALQFPGAVESAHMGHPDFRRMGKVFATLDYPGRGWGMVKLTPDQQRSYLRRAPSAFRPAIGAWGKSGSTIVQLELAPKTLLKAALKAAFANVAASQKSA
jgi:YjbR protein